MGGAAAGSRQPAAEVPDSHRDQASLDGAAEVPTICEHRAAATACHRCALAVNDLQDPQAMALGMFFSADQF